VNLPTTAYGRRLESIGWLQLGIEPIAEWLEGNWSLSRREVRTDFDGFVTLLAISPRVDRNVLVPAGPGWVALFSNGPLGTDVVGIVQTLSKVTASLGVHVRVTNSGCVFEVFRGDPVRNVWAAKDGSRWKFGEYGKAFDFEDELAYRSVRIKDRLTSEMVSRYLDALAVPAAGDLRFDELVVLESTT
jgi:hypothetical protein